jgi:hypothetical protein
LRGLTLETSYDEAINAADAAVRARGFDARAVSPAVRTVYLVGQLDFELTTGGVIQWLTNRSGGYASDTAHALDEIGATNCATLLRKILSFFRDGAVPEDDVARVAQIGLLRPAVDAAWRELGDSLLEWPDDVDVLLRRYVASHSTEFEQAARDAARRD